MRYMHASLGGLKDCPHELLFNYEYPEVDSGGGLGCYSCLSIDHVS